METNELKLALERKDQQILELERKLTSLEVLSPAEVDTLLQEGWKETGTFPCSYCFGRGCQHCHDAGMLVVLGKGYQTRFGAKLPRPGLVGAVCRLFYGGGKLKLVADGRGGGATLIFHYRQFFSLLEYLIHCLSNPAGKGEGPVYAVEAEFRGPPALQLAALTEERVTVSTFPDEQKRAALTLLREQGFVAEAELLASAFEHEVFRGDGAAAARSRAQIGELQPGEVIRRAGEAAVVETAAGPVALQVNSDRPLLNLLQDPH